MKYKVFVVKRADEAEDLLNKRGKQGYRIVPGALVLGGKTCLIMEKKELKDFPQTKEAVSEPEPAAEKSSVEKTSKDSAEVK